jgi:hypothetical protein
VKDHSGLWAPDVSNKECNAEDRTGKVAFTLKIGPNIITSKASVRPVHRARLSRVATAALLSEVA